MAIDVHLQTFSGPLDLLLGLIAEKKLPIGDIAISEVTDQYIKYIESLELDVDPVLLADFLVIATKLLFIKSKALLPEFGYLDEDEGESLEEQLRLYKAFVEVSKLLEKKWGTKVAFFRYEPTKKAEGFISPENVTIESMYDKMVLLVERLTPPKALPKTNIGAIVSLKQKIATLRDLIASKKQCSFGELIEDKENKTDIILSFLALLELVKQHTVSVNQQYRCGEIVIKRSE